MKRTIAGALLLAAALSLTIAVLTLTGRPLHAQTSGVCYAVADNGGSFGIEDALVTLDPVTGAVTLIGRTGSNEVEAIAFAPAGGTLYASDEEELGTLNLATGEYTDIGPEYGSASGAEGTLAIEDVDGLAWDAGSDILYGTNRRGDDDPDLLVQIDRTTGLIIQDAFGPDVGYVAIDGPDVMEDIDDIAVDPFTGVMYAASNDGGDGGVLITVDKNTGAGTLVGEFGVDDIEGIAYFTDGNLYGSTGKDGRDPATRNQLYRIDESTGAATLVAPFGDFRDYEALACLSGPTAVTLTQATIKAPTSIAGWLPATFLTLLGLTLLALYHIRTRN